MCVMAGKEDWMRTILSICAALIIMAALPLAARCQSDSLVENTKTVDGDVVSVDIQNSRITVKSYEVMIFSVPSDAKIVNADGFGIQLSAVNSGNYVTIDYKDGKSGNHIMQGMEVEYNR